MEVTAMRENYFSKQGDDVYKRWFDFADSDGDGRITGSDAVKFFSFSQLPKPDLKQVWSVADINRQGFLNFKDFVTAMKIISLAQAGVDISADMLKKADVGSICIPNMVGLEKLIAEGGHLVPEPEVQVEPVAPPSGFKNWFFNKTPQKVSPESTTSIIDGLKKLYFEKLQPLESMYQFNDFLLPALTESDFDAKPMVMLLGQYSTGKTTFIKHLLKEDYPGSHIGPEPTTDRFIVVMGGTDERSTPGNTVVVQDDKPFTGLSKFGAAFLTKFECSMLPNPLLDYISFIDSPGVLSGEKQRTQRSYDFTGVIEWFAAKCDLILLLFDPHKLDISDEFKRVISCLHGHDDKIKVVLNKADQVDTQQLMRVYGALMWSLGKVLNTPEVMRVYIGSFNDKPLNEGRLGPIGKELFEKEQADLLIDLMDIPRKACDRKVNEFVKRARAAKIHAHIIGHLKKQMPSMVGKSKAQQRLIDNLEEEFAKVQRELHLPDGDLPNVDKFRDMLSRYSIDKLHSLKPKLIQAVDDMLSNDIPDLLRRFHNPYDFSK